MLYRRTRRAVSDNQWPAVIENALSVVETEALPAAGKQDGIFKESVHDRAKKQVGANSFAQCGAIVRMNSHLQNRRNVSIGILPVRSLSVLGLKHSQQQGKQRHRKHNQRCQE